MKKHLTQIALALTVILAVAGIALLLYPIISNAIYDSQIQGLLDRYANVVNAIDPVAYDEEVAAVKAFNDALPKGEILPLEDDMEQEYNRLLNIGDTGIIGSLSIPKIDLLLPVYHSANNETLNDGAGHMAGSSLPIGQQGTHTVISAHSGMNSAKMFTDLPELEIGDTFRVNVLRMTFTYQVDQITTVLPEDTDALTIDSENDYCTLLTCVPFGVNDHRLLVRGHRIDTQIAESGGSSVSSGMGENTASSVKIVSTVVIGAVLVIGCIAMTILGVKARKKHKSRDEAL